MRGDWLFFLAFISPRIPQSTSFWFADLEKQIETKCNFSSKFWLILKLMLMLMFWLLGGLHDKTGEKVTESNWTALTHSNTIIRIQKICCKHSGFVFFFFIFTLFFVWFCFWIFILALRQKVLLTFQQRTNKSITEAKSDGSIFSIIIIRNEISLNSKCRKWWSCNRNKFKMYE